ncbi:four and a half LIM domains protein 2-like isoform X2 [Bradysia coprophila]|uniref:four and a half LIM domains protein 2-like isoform X2 n=1 Tax=Bradysia coprophila TaxID=38358 RepID=UPI00187D8630|nr:four and a half LIM domains protein 2-like isoform X2 [Bradysia coprophila]
MANVDAMANEAIKHRELADHGSENAVKEIEQVISENDKGDEFNTAHSSQVCCWHECHKNLARQRYVLHDDHPYCIKCYENVFSDKCEKCNKIIGIDSKNLSHNGKHWHKACFKCNKCRKSLVDKQFGSKEDKIYCGKCYDSQFASTCDACKEIICFGTKKMEYKARQWHENCFTCSGCKVFIGKSSFFPKEQEIYCSACYEEKYATKCVKCNSIITSYGVTYRNKPWHRRCFTCTTCKTYLSAKHFTSHDENPYCAECFGKLLAESNARSNPINVGVSMKKELPEKQIKNFLEEIFSREMRLKRKVAITENLKASNNTKNEI